MDLLLSQGARPDLVCRGGAAAIHLAAGKEAEKNTRCLKILLQHGADPNIRYGDKYSEERNHPGQSFSSSHLVLV